MLSAHKYAAILLLFVCSIDTALAGRRCHWCVPPADEPKSCKVGWAWDDYEGRCIETPRWKITKGKGGQFFCFNSTWNAKGNAHSQSAFDTCVSVMDTEQGLDFKFVAHNDAVQVSGLFKHKFKLIRRRQSKHRKMHTKNVMLKHTIRK